MSTTLRSAAIIIAVVVLDRATKLYILTHVSFWDVYPVIAGIFNIVHAENAGAAFSMLADAPIWIRKFLLVGISALVMAFIGVILWRPSNRSALQSSLMLTGLSLVFGGALGNLIDRIFRGTVTDFIQVFIGSYEFPSFNVADSAITIGAALLILDLLRSRKPSEH